MRSLDAEEGILSRGESGSELSPSLNSSDIGILFRIYLDIMKEKRYPYLKKSNI